MSRIDKRYAKWLNNTPTDVPINEVKAILKRFFPEQFKQNGTSHIVVQDDLLIGKPGYGPLGDFSIPIKGGKRVKGRYLKNLVNTIELLKEFGKWD